MQHPSVKVEPFNMNTVKQDFSKTIHMSQSELRPVHSGKKYRFNDINSTQRNLEDYVVVGKQEKLMCS